MAVRIGIDIGSSTTKIVAFEGEHMLPPMAVKADSQVASLYGAFGRYLYENNLQLLDVEGVYITVMILHILSGSGHQGRRE